MLKRLPFTRFDLTVFTAVGLLLTAIVVTVLLDAANQAGMRVAYMKISDSGFYEVWIADPEAPANARQVTNTQGGVNDFDVSGDGRYIVYSERDLETGISDIKLFDLRTNTSRDLTNCVMQDADCSAPRFRPDGEMIAYERLDRNTALGTGVGNSRIWLIDLSTNPATTYPLFEQQQYLGYGAEWSADGSQLAFYDSANLGILVRDMEEENETAALRFIPTSYGVVGSLSPEGDALAFPEMVLDGAQSRGRVQIADLETGFLRDLSNPNEGADDQQTAWNPTGEYIAVGRRYTDDRFTRGVQVYLYDTENDTISPLIFDERYSNGLFSWSPDGGQLALQRVELLDENGEVSTRNTTEVWTYDLETRQLTYIDDDAIRPLWVG